MCMTIVGKHIIYVFLSVLETNCSMNLASPNTIILHLLCTVISKLESDACD